MIIIVAIDDRGGMLFNKRRQSQDRVLRENILCMTAGKTLWMNAYSAKQFKDHDTEGHIRVDEDFLSKAGPQEYCFVENLSVKPYEAEIEEIILCKWNREYPGDFYFDIEVPGSSWRLTETTELKGSSHEKITVEVYVR